MKKVLLRIVLCILIAAVIAFYLLDIFVNQVKPTDKLFRVISIICICIAALIRTFAGQGRRSLRFYELHYKEFPDAFVTNSYNKKRFWSAIRLFNENKPDKALNILAELRECTDTTQDFYAVYFAAALCFEDMQAFPLAVQQYMKIVHKGIATSTIYSNLARIQREMGEYDMAIVNFKNALEYDQNNPYAYHNLASSYFKIYEFDLAIEYAQKALSINPNVYQSSSLLAIIYNLQGDMKNSQKYFHIAIASGQNPKELSDTIAFYKSAQIAEESDETDEENIGAVKKQPKKKRGR